MLYLWPLLILALPLIMTLAAARSAWIWAALFLSAAGLFASAALSSSSLASGGMGLPLGPLLGDPDDPMGVARTFHFAEIRRLTLTFLPSLIPALVLLWPRHPRRSQLDVALFWVFAGFAWSQLYLPTLILGQTGMPRTYVEFNDTLVMATGLAKFAGWLALATLVLATLRPIFVVVSNRRT